jgi:hypothetical protein
MAQTKYAHVIGLILVNIRATYLSFSRQKIPNTEVRHASILHTIEEYHLRGWVAKTREKPEVSGS